MSEHALEQVEAMSRRADAVLRGEPPDRGAPEPEETMSVRTLLLSGALIGILLIGLLLAAQTLVRVLRRA